MMYYRYEDYGFDFSDEPFPQNELADAAAQAAASSAMPVLTQVDFDGHSSAEGPGTVRLHLSNPNPNFDGEILLTLFDAQTGKGIYWCTGTRYYFGASEIELPWLKVELGQGDFESGKYYVEVCLA